MAFFIAPIPVWLFRNELGQPLSEGRIDFFRNDARDERKDVFQDPGGINPWSNPIVLTEIGTVPGLIYFNDDELYYIEVYDACGSLRDTIENFPITDVGGGGPPGGVSLNLANMYANPQFRFFTQNQLTNLVADVQRTAYLWEFEKNNTSATDSIQFIEFNLGVNDPVGTPIYYMRYETTGAGSGESIKDSFQTWNDVRTFESTEVSVALEARRPQGGGDLSVVVEQNFGTGGAPSAPIFTNIVTFSLTADWDKYQTTFIIPSVGGNTLGTDGNSFIRIRYRYPLNATTTIDTANFQFHVGEVVPPFPRIPFPLDKGKTASSLTPTLTVLPSQK